MKTSTPATAPIIIPSTLLLIAFAFAANNVFRQPFLTWDDSLFAWIGLPPDSRQHPLQLLSISYMSAKPALPVTISVAYLLFGTNPWAPVLFSLLMGTVLLSIVYQWAHRASGGNFGGPAAMAMLGSSFSFNWFSRWRGPQNAQMLFVAVLGLCLLQWSRTGKNHWISKAGFAAGIAVLYHYLSIYVVIAATLWLFFRNQHSIDKPNAEPSFQLRMRNMLRFTSWCALPFLVAVALSIYRPAGFGDASSSPVGIYYLETLYWQVVELGGGHGVEFSIPDLLIYPQLLVYYESFAALLLLALVEGYFILSQRRRACANRSQLMLMLYFPLIVLMIWSAMGSDARPRGLAMILPTAAVYLGFGLNQLLDKLPVSARHPLFLATLLLVGTVIVGIRNGLPLFNLHHPYYAIREQVALRGSNTLVGWKYKGGHMRPNEWKFLQRDLHSLERVIWADSITELTVACERDPDALILVSGGRYAPEHTGIRLLAQFDNPIDKFIPTLLADGQNVKLPPAQSRFLNVHHQGVRLFEFEQCDPKTKLP